MAFVDWSPEKKRAWFARLDAGEPWEKDFDLDAADALSVANHIRGNPGGFSDDWWVCDECGEGFKSAFWLQSHLASAHGVAHAEEGTGGDCPICGEHYISSTWLSNHVRRAHGG